MSEHANSYITAKTSGRAPVFRPSVEVEGLGSLYERLRNDFYLTFLFSQGEPDYQGHSYYVLSSDYRSHLSDEDRGHLPEVLSRFMTNYETPQMKGPKKISEPKGHKRINQADRTGVPRQQAEQLHLVLSEELLGLDPPTDISQYLGRLMARNMIKRDRYYIALRPDPANIYGFVEGRPNRQPGQDAFESHFQKYVLWGQPTESESFDRIMRSLRSDFVQSATAGEPPEVAALRTEWEAHHVFQEFYPPDLLELAK